MIDDLLYGRLENTLTGRECVFLCLSFTPTTVSRYPVRIFNFPPVSLGPNPTAVDITSNAVSPACSANIKHIFALSSCAPTVLAQNVFPKVCTPRLGPRCRRYYPASLVPLLAYLTSN